MNYMIKTMIFEAGKATIFFGDGMLVGWKLLPRHKKLD